MLEVMDLQETTTTSKLLALVMAMAVIHPDSGTASGGNWPIRPPPGACTEPDAPWLNLARLTRTDRLGELQQPALLYPKAPQSKIAISC